MTDGERAPLNRRRVLAAATRLADTYGIEAVTMRAVAAELSVEAMSLYHHVKGKEALLAGLIEEVAAEIEVAVAAIPARAATDWRAEVRARCLAARTVMLRHPWAPGLISAQSTIPAGLFLLFEAVLAAMIKGGLSYHLGHQAMHSLGSMVLGFSAELFGSGLAPEPMDDEAIQAEMAEMAATMPHITQMVAAEMHAAEDPMLGWCDGQQEFEFTLDLLLDGLQRRSQSPER